MRFFVHGFLRASAAVILCAIGLRAQSFELSTDEAGLGAASNLNGVAVADYDLDGFLDVYFVSHQQHDPSDPDTWNRLFRNNGDGSFSDVTTAAGVQAESIRGYEEAPGGMGNRFGAAWGDYDNDGDPDLLLTNVGPEILYRNDGDGTFTDITAEAGVSGDPEDLSISSSGLWWDYDDDGDLDLYISTWNSGLNRLYQNNGDGTFTDLSSWSGLQEVGSTWTSVPIDVNADGLLDLYVVNDFGANGIYVNNGDGTFSDETAVRGVGDRGHGMGVTVEDFNNDGYFDIYLTNIYTEKTEWNQLYMNDGTGRFTDVSRELGVDNADWAWGTEFFDCDHDGDLDLYVANGFVTQPAFPNRIFVNNLMETGQPGFHNEGPTAGVAGHAEARGVVSFDYDNDGDLDVVVSNARPGQGVVEENGPYLYKNVSSTQNWLKIDLAGTASNRFSVGAAIRVTAGGQTMYRHNDGVGFLGQSIRPIHVGLGQAQLVDEVEVRWPNGRTEVFGEIEANRLVRLEEGQGVATAVDIPPLSEDPGLIELGEPYPNPSAGVFSLPLSNVGAGAEVRVWNVLGQMVSSKRITPGQAGTSTISIDARALPAGTYYVGVEGRKLRTVVLAD